MCREEKKHSLLTQNDFPTQQVHANRKKLRKIENHIFELIPKFLCAPSHENLISFILNIKQEFTQKRKVDDMLHFPWMVTGQLHSARDH